MVELGAAAPRSGSRPRGFGAKFYLYVVSNSEVLQHNAHSVAPHTHYFMATSSSAALDSEGIKKPNANAGV